MNNKRDAVALIVQTLSGNRGMLQFLESTKSIAVSIRWANEPTEEDLKEANALACDVMRGLGIDLGEVRYSQSNTVTNDVEHFLETNEFPTDAKPVE